MEQAETVRRVLDEQGIAIYFQPLVSVESKGIVGFEAFSRGVDREGRTIADAGVLFNEKLPMKEQYDLELLCHKESLESFETINNRFKDMLLFLNVNSNIYNSKDFARCDPASSLTPFHYSPKLIVFEFDVAQLADQIPVVHIKKLKQLNYRICLDSIQENVRSRELTLLIKPDFVKIDRSFYDGIDKSAQVVDNVKSAAHGCRRAGVQPIAKGVETEQEATALALAGVTLQQGYFYTDTGGKKKESFNSRVTRLNSACRDKEAESFKVGHDHFCRYHLLLKKTMNKLTLAADAVGTNKILEHMVRKNDEVVTAFVLSASGKQLSSRFVGRSGDFIGKRIESCAVGSDHSLKEYFMYLNSGFDKIAGATESSPFCRGGCRYLAGFYFNEERRKGEILVIEYSDCSRNGN